MKIELRTGTFYPFILVAILGVLYVVDRYFGVDFISNSSEGKSSPHFVDESSHESPNDHASSSAQEELTTETDDTAVEDSLSEDAAESFSAAGKASFVDRLQAYRDSISSSLDPGERRQDIVVRYYPHAPDGDIIYKLEELGYYVHNRETTGGLENMQTNAIYYGDSVDVRDIQIVANFLIAEGLVIRQIVPSRFHADWKVNAIEIGASVQAQTNEPLSLDDLEAFEKVY